MVGCTGLFGHLVNTLYHVHHDYITTDKLVNGAKMVVELICGFVSLIVKLVMKENLKIKEMALRGLEIAAASHLQKGRTSQELLKTLLAPDSHKQERLSAGINLVGIAVPGFEEFLGKVLTNRDKLPFKTVDPNLFFRGGENSIFLIRDEESSTAGEEIKVLKINLESLGGNRERLLQIANRIKEEYEKTKSWYADIPDFVPEENTLILHSHLLGKPAVATVQQFIPGEKRGIFEDYSEDELVEKLGKDEYLRSDFVSFCRKLVDIYEETGECIDLPGERNIIIVEEDGKSSLVLLDPHIIHSPERLSSFGPLTAERPQERVSQLKSILSKLEEKPIHIE